MKCQQKFAFKFILWGISLTLIVLGAANAANTTPPTVTITNPIDNSSVSGTIVISVDACPVPSTETIVAIQVRFDPPGSGPKTSWREMSFDPKDDGCVTGTDSWVTNEFGPGTVGIEARAADDNGLTKFGQSGWINVSVSEGSPVCGNGVIEVGEECDGVELGNATCDSKGFYCGALACLQDCTLDTTNCVSGSCGDGMLQCNEVCESDINCNEGEICNADCSGCELPALPAGDRHMFVWDDLTIISNPAEVTDMLDFAESKNVSVIYLDFSFIDPEDENNATIFSNAIAAAHSRGIEVYALGGDPWWGVSCNTFVGQPACIDDGVTFWTKVMDYQNNTSFEDVDGFNDNTEPYRAEEVHWWSNVEERAQMLLDYHATVRSLIGSGSQYIATIPFWYDQDNALVCLKLDGKKGKCKSLSWYLSEKWQYANVTAIMAYRDYAIHPTDPNNGIIPFSQGEINSFKTIIGVETQLMDGDPGTVNECELFADQATSDGPNDCAISFWEEKESGMETALKAVYDEFSFSQNFIAFFLHYYDSYSDADFNGQ